MNETGHGQHRRTRRRNEQNGFGHRGELDRTSLHAPHRLAVRHVQSLILGEPASEHVALPAELFNLSFERGDTVFGVAPQRRQLVNVRVCAALRECRCERTSKRVPQPAELLVLDARKRLRSVEQWEKQQPFDVVEVHARQHATDRPALHRIHGLSNGGLSDHLGAKAREIENAVVIVVEQDPRHRGRGVR